MALLTAPRAEDNRCDIGDIPGIFATPDFTVLPSRWSLLLRFLKKRCVDFSLAVSGARRGGVIRFGISRCGRKAVDLARYVQLVNRTMITLIGNRWSKGLIVTVNEKSVLGTSKVEVQAFWSVRPII